MHNFKVARREYTLYKGKEHFFLFNIQVLHLNDSFILPSRLLWAFEFVKLALNNTVFFYVILGILLQVSFYSLKEWRFYDRITWANLFKQLSLISSICLLLRKRSLCSFSNSFFLYESGPHYCSTIVNTLILLYINGLVLYIIFKLLSTWSCALYAYGEYLSNVRVIKGKVICTMWMRCQWAETCYGMREIKQWHLLPQTAIQKRFMTERGQIAHLE